MHRARASRRAAATSPTSGAPTTASPTTGGSGGADDSSSGGAPTGGSSSTGDDTGEVSCDDSPFYRVGAGIHDVTGPVAELVMMGYSMPEQKAEGISTRLWSRAFVVESPCSGGRIAFVSADLGQVFQGVHLEVLKRLEDHFGPGVYTRDNVALSATHTHSGVAGFSHYTMFNLAVPGYDPDNFEAVVSGIVASIIKAHDNLGDGVVKIAQGPLQDANWNRSPQAYAGNPQAERDAHEAEHDRDTNTRMTVLRFERTQPGETSGQPIGALAWFSSHATSVSNQNRLISGDHKGLASYYFERSMGADYTAKEPFIAAFAQSDAGDVSPNEVVLGAPNTVVRPCDGSPDPECDDLANAAIHGEKQYARALELWDAADELLRGPVDGRLAFYDMEEMAVDSQYTGAGPQQTCKAAIGFSIAAGAEDGVAVAFIDEGIKFGENFPPITLDPIDQACHEQKAILLPVGRMLPFPWSPTILPAQVLRLGGLAILPVPFEITTMSGDRLRATVLAHLGGAGIDRAVIAGLSNGYSSYVTTHEEYQAQHYEGAFTQFGPWTLAAWQQNFATVADALQGGVAPTDTGAPLDLSDEQILQTAPVVADSPCLLPDQLLCLGEKFGDVVQDPPAMVSPGDHVVVRFRGAHPRNDLRTGAGYLEVQRADEDWLVVARDWDPETTFRWQRTGGPLSPSSEVTIDWRVPQDAEPGEYRIVYHGDARSLGGTISPISGTSPTFLVQ
jgi:neutral ceramidase